MSENSPQEEGQPADDKSAHDDAQRPGRLVLPLHLDDVPVVPGRGRVVIVGRQCGPGRRTVGGAVRRPQLVLGQLPVVVDLLAATDPRVYLLLLPISLFEYRVVREKHDRAGYPKRYGRRHDHVHFVHLKNETPTTVFTTKFFRWKSIIVRDSTLWSERG